MTRGETSNHTMEQREEDILRLSHEVNGKTMEPGEDLFKFMMEINRSAADLYILGNRYVTELRQSVIIVAGLSADYRLGVEC